MGFLHKLWDETFAGPTPDTGLGKLRKYDSFSLVRSPPPPPPPPIITPDQISVTRSIIILPTKSKFRNVSGDSNSVPSSPAGSSAPISPFSRTTPRGRGYFKRLTRTKSSPEEFESAEPRSPTVYDWLFVSF
ncbi:dormancy-associated protein homolog 4-like [Cornus florida]|uniref:dormancy-associated protein homolog 4-like n=1 Tax=Cornus florida TaxID=4283 RepID=UPI00289E30A5|nr:dormancy-associated protein homolog 4-like [Cornus florida]